ncbi:MAG: TIGR02206 family membrane protein [Gemmatimonadaceae bacterium]
MIDTGPAWSEFEPFSALHAGILLLFAMATALLIYGGRRLPPPGRSRLDRNLGLVMIALWVVSNGWWLLPARFDAARALPLHVCDVTSLLAGVVLLLPRRRLRALLYFWGIGMSLQAIVTPEIAFEADSIWFWIFWTSHAGIIGIAIYDVVVRGYRPDWADFRFVVLAGLAYLAVVLAINVMLGFNYGYVGNARPGEASIIDFLGPWPYRVAVMAVLVIGVMVLLMLPWHFAREARKKN